MSGATFKVNKLSAPNVRQFNTQCKKNARKIQIFTKNVHLIVLHKPQRHKNHAAETFHTQYTAYRKHSRCQHHPIWTISKEGNVAMRKEKVHEKAAIRIAREL